MWLEVSGTDPVWGISYPFDLPNKCLYGQFVAVDGDWLGLSLFPPTCEGYEGLPPGSVLMEFPFGTWRSSFPQKTWRNWERNLDRDEMMSDFSSWTQTEQEVLLALVKSLSLEFGIVLITHRLKNKMR